MKSKSKCSPKAPQKSTSSIKGTMHRASTGTRPQRRTAYIHMLRHVCIITSMNERLFLRKNTPRGKIIWRGSEPPLITTPDSRLRRRVSGLDPTKQERWARVNPRGHYFDPGGTMKGLPRPQFSPFSHCPKGPSFPPPSFLGIHSSLEGHLFSSKFHGVRDNSHRLVPGLRKHLLRVLGPAILGLWSGWLTSFGSAP